MPRPPEDRAVVHSKVPRSTEDSESLTPHSSKSRILSTEDSEPPTPHSGKPRIPSHVAQEERRDFQALLIALATEYDRIKVDNANLLATISRLAGMDQPLASPSLSLISDAKKCPDGPDASSKRHAPNTEQPLASPSISLISGAKLSLDGSESPKRQANLAAPSKMPPNDASLGEDSQYTVAKSSALVTLPNVFFSQEPKRFQPELHYLWTQSFASLAAIKKKLSKSLTIKLDPMEVRGGDVRRGQGHLQRLMVGPNTKKRALWDVIGILILSVDIIMVPLIAFDMPDGVAMKALGITCTVFWTCDIMASCISGFHIEGMIEMRPRMVLRNYVRGWFAFDMFLVLTDWILLGTTSEMADIIGVFRMGKVLRFGRVVRVFRLLRVMKAPAFLDDFSYHFQTDSLLAAFQVLRALITIGVVNHFLACGWYAVGQLGSPSWIDKLDDQGRDLAYRYISSLHWSLTQFTPASCEIHPMNFHERLYAICVLFLALVVFSSFVSSITNAMNDLRLKNEAASKQRTYLRNYMHQNRLSLQLVNLIIGFVKHLNVQTKARVHEAEVDAFAVLPGSLRLQLHFEVYVPLLSVHPLFFECVALFEPFVLELCHVALSETSLRGSHELFNPDEEGKSMYLLISGSLSYFEGKTDIPTANLDTNTDERTTWCCEVTLWMTWTHQGQLAAQAPSELAVVEASMFRRCVSQTPQLFEVCKVYARAFETQVREKIEKESGTKSLDMFPNHDEALEMSQHAFEKSSASVQEMSTTKTLSMRAWHSFSLIRVPTPPRLGSSSRSNTN